MHFTGHHRSSAYGLWSRRPEMEKERDRFKTKKMHPETGGGLERSEESIYEAENRICRKGNKEDSLVIEDLEEP